MKQDIMRFRFILISAFLISSLSFGQDCTNCFDDGPAGCGKQGYYDGDGDGFGTGNIMCFYGTNPSNFATKGGDCNDSNGNIYPRTFYLDTDGDGFGIAIGTTFCQEETPPAGYVERFDDCDDTDAAITITQNWYQDNDNDGFGDSTTQSFGCYPLASMTNPVTVGGDIDDSNAIITNIPPMTFYYDGDGDGFGLDSNTEYRSEPSSSFYVPTGGDCNDNNAAIHPNSKWYLDVDGDGLGGETFMVQCAQPAGSYALLDGDVCPDDEGPEGNNGCPPEDCTAEPYNTVLTYTYNLHGEVTSKSKVYNDNLGKQLQTQSLDIKTGKVWASQTLYDQQGRGAMQTLSAPINDVGHIFYEPNFIKNDLGNNYATTDFETDTENPSQVGTTANTLGHYYSQNNTDANFEGNSYQDVTQYPFSRTIYSELNPGAGLKTLGGNKVDHDNDPNTPEIWLQGHVHSMLTGQELSQADAFNDTSYDAIDIIKTVSRDVHGVESVLFTDTDGKTLAAARSGGETSREMTIAILEQGFVDIHVPENENAKGFIVSSGDITVYDLITEEVVTGATTTLPNGFYRVVVNELDAYTAGAITVTYKENYYDYTLNEYNEIGQLVASYQPLSKLMTEFKYNVLGQLTYSKSPDEGEAWFKYQEDGQIRFSQNSKQKLANEFSYTNYDSFGRPVESGVVLSSAFNTIDPDGGSPSGLKEEQQYTTYDELAQNDLNFLATLPVDYHTPTFLTSNVVKTSNANTSTYYSYDVYGRVQWMIQNITGLGIKTIDYNYDPITGNVLEVDYQKHNTAEHFVHRYTYNIVHELQQVETSTNGVTFTNQARYEYYETGALRRTELANNLQGIDYVYNLAGQLKAINDPQGNDPGGDGASGEHSNFNPDVFSMSLNYYKGDYARTGTPKVVASVLDGKDQYNGNIKAMTWKNMHPNGSTEAQTYYYGYNKNNWLENAGFGAPVESNGTAQDSITKSSLITTNTDLVARQSIRLLPNFHVQSGTLFSAKIDPNAQGSDGGDYNVSNITYDQNGNIKSLNRNKHSENGGSNAMDQLSYEYYDDSNDPNNEFKPNQLKRVEDAAGVVAGANDIDTQTGDNYIYNEIGQLVENVNEGVQYVYNTSGLVIEVQHNNQPAVKFYYNDKNHRVRKESFTNGNLTSTDHYIRDATGNTLAIYKNSTLTELPIYGASRIGVHYKAGGIDRYQLTDHLGNVRAVIARSNNDVAISTTTDYYPFGMPMPGRQTIGGEQYRYAFQGQEKDPETGKEAFQLRLWDARIGRWLSPDPYGEFFSPYLGMGNNPISTTDPDGGRTCKDPNGNIVNCSDYGISTIYNIDLPEFEVIILPEIQIFGRRADSKLTEGQVLQKLDFLEDYHRRTNAMQKPFAEGFVEVITTLPIFSIAKIGAYANVGKNGFKRAIEGKKYIYRAVSKSELDDIAINGFRLKPGGYETKLFAPTSEEATRFGRLNFNKDGIPNTIMKVEVDKSILQKAYKGHADGMNMIAIDKEFLNKLNGEAFNHSQIVKLF